MTTTPFAAERKKKTQRRHKMDVALRNKLMNWAEQYETAQFIEQDPVRGDFALFGYGVEHKTIRK